MDLAPEARLREPWRPERSRTIELTRPLDRVDAPVDASGDSTAAAPEISAEGTTGDAGTTDGDEATGDAAIGDEATGDGETRKRRAEGAGNVAPRTDGDFRELVAELNVPAELHHLVEVRDRAAAIASALGFPERSVEEVRLAVGEAYVNAVRHGSCERKGGQTRAGATILVRMLASGAEVVVEVKDSGPGFDLASVSLLPMDELSAGGRGIFFMKIAMDSVDFDFSDGTLVRMTKHCPLPGVACAG
ncbi:MAG: ATP-binding protein [Chloroflexi bacterium]|nr:ATP-binding protein [Chloroflexota bacterium]